MWWLSGRLSDSDEGDDSACIVSGDDDDSGIMAAGLVMRRLVFALSIGVERLESEDEPEPGGERVCSSLPGAFVFLELGAPVLFITNAL